jgi:hypothetical protein
MGCRGSRPLGYDLVGVVRADISDECVASLFRVETIGKRGETFLRNVGSKILQRPPNPRRRYYLKWAWLLECESLGILPFFALVIYLSRPYRLRCYVTNRKVAGSRPDEVNDFYQFF